MQRSLELFAGAGGLALGAGRAGFNPVAVIEWDRHCCETIRENQQHGHPEVAQWPLAECDVRAFNYSGLPPVDLVTGGPPCQPFSIGGKHKAFSDERNMFPEAVRAVRELTPKAFIFENVKGLTRASFSNFFEYIKLQLAYPDLIRLPDESWQEHFCQLEKHHTYGKSAPLYNVVTRVLNAADFGVPQRRERVFFVGFRADIGANWCFPDPSHSRDALQYSKWVTGEYWERHGIDRPSAGMDLETRQLDLISESKAWRTVRDAISDLPDPEHDLGSLRIANHKFQPGARSYIGHTGSPLDEPSKTLKAGDHGVPGGENMLSRPDGSVRYFTVRESARLQTFPDDYVFHGTWSETMRQLGNAVPVKLASLVVQSVKRQLDQITKEDHPVR